MRSGMLVKCAFEILSMPRLAYYMPLQFEGFAVEKREGVGGKFGGGAKGYPALYCMWCFSRAHGGGLLGRLAPR